MGTQTRFCTIVPAITLSRKSTRKNKQRLNQILTLHTYIHTHRSQADSQARAHLYTLAHTHTHTLTAMRMHSRP